MALAVEIRHNFIPVNFYETFSKLAHFYVILEGKELKSTKI